MKCEICGQGPISGESLYRTGEKGPGKNPHWRCQFHMIGQMTNIPEDVATIVAIIERENDGTNYV